MQRSAPPHDGGSRQDDVLSAERHRKADGRLLILYRWDRREQAPAGATDRRGAHTDTSTPAGENG